MLLRFSASTTALPFVVSPASMSTCLPDGDEMSIESPLIGPTSRMRTVSSPPEAGGGCVLHHGRTHFQPAKAPAPITTKRTATAHPQPRVARPTLDIPVLCYRFMFAFVHRLRFARDPRRILPVPTRDTRRIGTQPRRSNHSFHRQVTKRVGFDELFYLFNTHLRRD